LTEPPGDEVEVTPHHYVKALEIYNTAAQFNATSMVAVVFGQFVILTLLEGRARELLSCPCRTWPIWFLIWVYGGILCLGCYFILNYLMFAQFIEKLRSCPGVRSLEKLEDELLGEDRSLKDFRACVLGIPHLGLITCILYAFLSIVVLWAVLNLPPRLNFI
jgi:hypothetical protein